MIQGVQIVEKMTMSKVLKQMKPPYVPETDRPDRSCEWELFLPKLKVTFWLSGDTPRSRVISIGFDKLKS